MHSTDFLIGLFLLCNTKIPLCMQEMPESLFLIRSHATSILALIPKQLFDGKLQGYIYQVSFILNSTDRRLCYLKNPIMTPLLIAVKHINCIRIVNKTNSEHGTLPFGKLSLEKTFVWPLFHGLSHVYKYILSDILWILAHILILHCSALYCVKPKISEL